MRYHLIAVGGNVMHTLAITLQAEGHTVTGSDDTIFEPSRTRLANAGLLPATEGWDPARITPDLDAVIIGMHARADNPELRRAQQLGIRILSFPQFIYERSRNKQRLVVTGSHGKTSVTAMLMHVLQKLGTPFDYLIGAAVPGFEGNLRLSPDAPLIILEGDEYPASVLDNRPKFEVYDPHIVVLTGIAWDHVNVYPTRASYVAAFDRLLANLPKAGALVYNKQDKTVRRLALAHLHKERHYAHPYTAVRSVVRGDQVYALLGGIPGALPTRLKGGKRYPLSVFGKHNMQNIGAVLEACKQLAIEPEEALTALADFRGAALRMEVQHQSPELIVIRDYAHAPSKLKATLRAATKRYRKRQVVACYELHTYSSLNPDFLAEYAGSLKDANAKIVFVDENALKIKQMAPIRPEQVRKAFRDKDITLVTTRDRLLKALQSAVRPPAVLMLMSSGSFGGLKTADVLAALNG